MKNQTLVFIAIAFLLFNGLASCSDPREEAMNYLETIRYEIYLPADEAVSQQNDAIGAFMKRMKERKSIDLLIEVRKMEELRSIAAKKVDEALVKIKTVNDIECKNDLKKATITYLQKIAEFEKNLEPVLNDLKGGLDPMNILNFSSQLTKGKELGVQGEKYQSVLKAFMGEFEISMIDEIRMNARHSED